jgi:hypothetical protein
MTTKPKKHKFAVGDLVRLKSNLQERIINHKQIFRLYSQWGGPREWICNMVGLGLMRVTALSYDLGDIPVVTLHTDPCDQKWHEDWFELVASNAFVDQEDLFEV